MKQNIEIISEKDVDSETQKDFLNKDINIEKSATNQKASKIDNVIDNTNKPENIRNSLSGFMDRLDVLMDSKNGITGIATGFSDIDKLTSVLLPGNLIVVAGRPSMGKTSFAMNIAENVARDADKPVLFFSLEMQSEEFISRMISSLKKVNQTKLRNGKLDDEDWTKITAAMQIITKEMNLYIDDSAGISPAEIREKACRIAKDNSGLSLIVVDYLQLMNIPGYGNNRTQEVSAISRSLKALSKELNVPVIALSQLNRAVEDRTDRRPMMSDLRDSGSIEQDADVIMFVYRDEFYNIENPKNKGVGEIIIGKQRNGPIGVIPVTFAGKYFKFSNYSHVINFSEASPSYS